MTAVAACLFFYLLALDSYCDDGGNFALGICSVTRFVPGKQFLAGMFARPPRVLR